MRSNFLLTESLFNKVFYRFFEIKYPFLQLILLNNEIIFQNY